MDTVVIPESSCFRALDGTFAYGIGGGVDLFFSVILRWLSAGSHRVYGPSEFRGPR